MSVTIVHEWLTNLAGSEKVVDELRRTFPGAAVSTTMQFGQPFASWDRVNTSWLQPLATGPSAHVRALPAMPVAWRSVEIPEADLYISSFHTFSLHARVPLGAPHLVYCHTPPRFLWGRSQLRAEGRRALLPAMSLAATLLAPIDRRRAGRPTHFIANSNAVAARIRHTYRRDASVVHPPVDVERFACAAEGAKDDYFLFLSRLVPYKRADLAIAAFAELGWPLVVVGGGRSRDALERTAPPNVRFLGHVDDAALPGLLARARAMVFPAEEDFGIAPVEAMAAGTPVVALGRGGALDYVQPGRNGLLFSEQSVPALVAALREAAAHDWRSADIQASVAHFGPQRFGDEIRRIAANVA